ncbi:hypothetical protein LMG933_20805, partial [Xanthomonas euvesicatoria]
SITTEICDRSCRLIACQHRLRLMRTRPVLVCIDQVSRNVFAIGIIGLEVLAQVRLDGTDRVTTAIRWFERWR